MSNNKATLSGSISVFGDIEMTGSLIGTASWALNAVSASHALLADGLTATSLTLADLTITNTASIEYLNVIYQSSSVIYSSGSNIFGDAPSDTQTLHGQVEVINDIHVGGTLQVDGGISGNLTGSVQGNASTATSASYALVADFAQLAASSAYADLAELSVSGSHAVESDHALNADYAQGTLSASYSATSDLAQVAISASYSANSDLAQSAISSSYAATSDYAQSAISASYASNSDLAQNAISASHALNSDYAQGALSASYSNTSDAAQTAISSSHALASDTAISASHALLADGLNATSLTLADLVITNTASIQYLDVIFQSSSIIYSSGSNIFGDASDDTQTLHGQVEILNDGHIYGTLQVDGGISGNITGSLQGNADTATSASFASYANNATSALTASYFLTSSVTSASYAQFSDLAQSALTASYFLTSSVTSASYALTASHVLGTKDVGFQKEWHVSVGSGSDATGNGSLSKPFATLGKAFSVVGGTGEQIVVHPGLYLEATASLTMPNVSIVSANFNAGGICYFNGAITIAAGSSSTRISGLLFNNLIHSGSAGLYLDKVQVKANYTKIGNGYSEITNSDLQATGSVQFKGGVAVFQGDKIIAPVVSGSGTALYIKDAISVVAPSAVAGGTLVLSDSQVYPAVSGSAAVTSAAGTVVYLYNTQITTTTGLPERINIGGFLGYDDVQFNKNLSTLGTSLNTKAHFQLLDVNGLSATGSLFGTASWANNATSASFATVANGLNPGSSVSVVNVTGSGNLQIAGSDINFANLPVYTNDFDAAAGGVRVGSLYRNGNFIQIRIS
jgi:hypothetical protein